MKKLLFLTIGLWISISIAAIDVLPITLTTADGLPGKFTGDCNEYTTRLFEFEEPVKSIRFTVITTNTTDTLTSYSYDGLSAGYGPGFPFFTMSEFKVYDADGNVITLNEDAFSSNAVATNEGSLANLADGSTSTYFHGTYWKGTLPQAYHYLEVVLPEPMKSFKLKWYLRVNRKNMPTTIGITEGGTEYLPYPEYGFKLGEQVTTLEELAEGGVFVLKGSYFSHTPDQSYERNEDYRGDAYYHSPYGGALTPSAADLITFIPTGEEDTYYIHWIVNGHYVYNPVGRVTSSDYANWVNSSYYAGKFKFTQCDSVPGSFIIKSDNIYLAQRRFVKMSVVNDTCTTETSTYHYAWNVYKADISNIKGTQIENNLTEVTNTADSLINLQGYIEDEDNGEYEALIEAVAEARSLIEADNTPADIAVNKTNEIDLLTAEYRKQYLFLLIDSIEYILNDADLDFTDGSDGWNVGSYPIEYQLTLGNLVDEANIRVDNITALIDISLMIEELKEGIDNLFASRVEKVYSLPLRFNEKDGLPGVREKGESSSYIWDTPLLYLNSPIDVIRITVTKKIDGGIFDGSGTAFFALGEFELYNTAGEQIILTEDMFETNSLNNSDGYGLAGLIDGNHSTWYHGAYGEDQDIVPGVGEYAYLQVNLNEPISAFRYRMVSRANKNYSQCPVDFGITAGTEYDPDLIPEEDPYNLQVIEKVTDVSQITADGLYILYGNFGKYDGMGGVIGEGSGYYTGINVYDSKYPHSCCLFTFENADEGKFYLRSLSKDYYVKQPLTWSDAYYTYFKNDAASFTITENDEIGDVFKMYYTGTVNDELSDINGEEAYFMLQDWGKNMATYPITDLAYDDTDGQSDWEIYKVSIDNYGLFMLESVLAAIEASGFTAEAFGANPGQYSGAGAQEFKDALIAAQALAGTKDDAAAKTAAITLQNNIEALANIQVNPVVIGNEYYIISTYSEFYANCGKEMAIFSDVNDDSDTEITSKNQPYWGILLDEANGTEEEYTWIFEEGDTNSVEETIADYTYVYLKNKETGEYMGTVNTWSKRLPMSEKPTLYFVRPYGNANYGLGSYEAQLNFSSNNETYPYLHILGHDDGKADWGHICFWSYSANQSKWKLVNANTTSIKNNVVNNAKGEIVSTVYYNSDGKISAVPTQGVNIVKTVYANGVIKTKKIYVK